MPDRPVSFYGRVIDGKIKLLNRQAFDRLVASWDTLEIDVLLRKHRKPRSTPQNKYLWGVVYEMIADSTGNEPEAIHDAMKALFLTDYTGIMPVVRSTTDLSTVEFNEYIEKIVRFAAEKLDLVIPDPE